MIFQPEIETMGREEMRALQLQRLQQTVRYVYERVPLYRERLDALKVRPEDITLPGRHAPPALHHQGGPPRQLPLRPVRRAA